jgi:hypothetical protein
MAFRSQIGVLLRGQVVQRTIDIRPDVLNIHETVFTLFTLLSSDINRL